MRTLTARPLTAKLYRGFQHFPVRLQFLNQAQRLPRVQFVAPRSLFAFRQVRFQPGIGPRKLELYGADVLATVSG